MPLTERKQRILSAIIEDTLSRGLPVASEMMVRRHSLGVSPATVRNEMAELEEEGYLYRPHPSAGGLPSDKAYRYYVEYLVEEVSLTPSEEAMLRHQFFQIQGEVEEWPRLAAAVLARLAGNLALVTQPKAIYCHFSHLSLVSLQEYLALVVLLLRGARVRQGLLSLGEVLSQEDLNALAAKFNHLFSGLDRFQIPARRKGLSPQEARVMEAVAVLMAQEDERTLPEPFIVGYRQLFNQPEFAHQGRLTGLMDLLDAKELIRQLLAQAEGGLRVMIGDENPEGSLRFCSVVLSDYGVSGEARGTLGVLGPTRMAYGWVIPRVRFLASLLSELFGSLYGARGTP